MMPIPRLALVITVCASLGACAAMRPVSDEDFVRNGTATGLSAKPASAGATSVWMVITSALAEMF